MPFNSLIFLLFAALFFIVWPLVRRGNHSRWIFIIIASLLFYGWWDWRFIFLLTGCGLVNFYAGLLIRKFQRYKKTILVLSLFANLGILGLFKYLGFFTRNLNALGLDIPVVTLALPVGISFYTFQAMSYVIDVYKGTVEPTYNFFHFFAYLSTFPHLIAGPIIRPSQLLSQLAEARKATDPELWEGFKLIVYGYFKKVVVADNLGLLVNVAFRQEGTIRSFPYWWIIITFFAIQIYCDFAGYTDIARGLAKLMGYDFPINFNHPYISRSLHEFWSRWHISLSTWFRDYVFFPLLQRKVTVLNAHISMGITLLLSGLWHGAGWTFVIWGGLHAVFFSVEQLTRWPKRLKRSGFGKVLSTLIVLFLVWIAWVFFRAETLDQAVAILKVMLNPTLAGSFPFRRFTIIHAIVVFLALTSEIAVFLKINEKIKKMKHYWIFETVGVALALTAVFYLRGAEQIFIYFQF
jgi:alginate O-acetyltransferase complex protein AlgI